MTGKTCSFYRKRTCFLFAKRKEVPVVCRAQRSETITLCKMWYTEVSAEEEKRFVCISPVAMAGLFLYLQPWIELSRTEWARGGEGCNDQGLLIEVFDHVGWPITLSALKPAETKYSLTGQAGTSQLLLGLVWFCSGCSGFPLFVFVWLLWCFFSP